MDFWPTDDQLALRDGVRSFLAGRFALDDVAALEPDVRVVGTDVVDRQRWRELAGLGVFSLAADGLGARDAVIVFEELGRSLVPGPLATTFVAATLGVEGAGDGTRVIGLVEPDVTWGSARRHTTDSGLVRHTEREERAIVEHLGSLDAALVWSGDDVHHVPAEQLGGHALARPTDALSPVWSVRVHAPTAAGAGDVLASGDDARRARLIGTLLTAGTSVGVAAAATDLAVAYARERQQFGRPIGSFQAVKHLLAEMFTHADVARAAVHAAACALDDASDDDPARAVSSAKVMASEAGLFCGRTGIQVHGGMGFTWEVHAQRYWKRAVVLAMTFGTIDDHAEEVARCL